MSETREIYITVQRRTDEPDAKSYDQEYIVVCARDEVLSLLDALEIIYRDRDSTLAFFRHASCRQSACGGCLVRANGRLVLACREKAEGEVRLEPWNDKVVRDLVCSP